MKRLYRITNITTRRVADEIEKYASEINGLRSINISPGLKLAVIDADERDFDRVVHEIDLILSDVSPVSDIEFEKEL
ncbi:MAG: hypothetical protein MJ101_07230 [Clostridia bacterium]|nr:hypothetical protein [Clostridia bacterium]